MSEPTAEDLAEIREARRESAARRRQQRLARSGIPLRWQVGFDALERDERSSAIEAAQAWAAGGEEAPAGVVLWGGVGVGKTMMAGAAATGRVARGRVTWLSVARLMRDLMMPFSSPEYVAACRAMTPSGDALVLDDLDKIRATEMAAQVLYVAVNDWTDADLPLLVTMNRHPSELVGKLGEDFGPAIESRLVEHCEVHEVVGRDRRTEP